MIVAGIHTQACAADLVAGEKISQSCALCHGQFGITSMAGTPSIAGQPEVYLSSQLKQFRDGKRQNAVMGQMAKPLSDADIDNMYQLGLLSSKLNLKNVKTLFAI